MRAPAFWWREAPSGLAHVLRPAALIYGTLARRRMEAIGEPASCPVICVGNFTVGGAGKTPTVLALAALLGGTAARPAFLSRGYGGRLAGPIRVDPARHSAAEVGDEPLLLARSHPTVVSRDRRAGAALCRDLGADLIIMDDGLQNPSLRKEVALAVVDGATGIGNGLCLPAGPLRAPLDVQWRHVDAVLVVGPGAAGDSLAQAAEAHGKTVLRASLRPDAHVAAQIRGHRVLAFAGIGRPDKFFASLAECGAVVVERRPFPDHHRYTAAELARLETAARRQGLILVTTEKDWVRLAGSPAASPLLHRITTLPVRLVIEDGATLKALVTGRSEASVSRRAASALLPATHRPPDAQHSSI